MKNGRKQRSSSRADDGMLSQYRFNYSNARQNRFAARLRPGSRVIVLAPDVAEVFPTPESVNAALRALIDTMQRGQRAKK